MKQLTPQIIAEITGGEYIGNESDRDARITGAVRDNRDVKPGNMFVCFRGARADGHSFANSAYASGASCCLAEQALPDPKGPYVMVGSTLGAIKEIGRYYRNLHNIPVIGVTGSVGKTTTKEMIACVLGVKAKVLKTTENMNNELGVPLTLLSLDESHKAAVIEMGISNFGEMSQLALMVKPDIMIITKIGYSHIASLGDLNGVLRAKTEVFNFMSPESTAIMNGDDELQRQYNPGIRKALFGLNEYNDFRAENIYTNGTESVTFDIVSASGRFKASIPSYGSHLAAAALAATAVGRELGLTDDDIAHGLLSYKPVDGRARVKDTGYITLIDDCYNANPNSVMAALTSLSKLRKRKVAVLGDMLELGGKSEQLHREIGSFAAQSNIDSLICCGEMAESIFDEYQSAGGRAARYYPSKPELIKDLDTLILKGDAVLVKASHGMGFEELLPYLRDFQEPGITV